MHKTTVYLQEDEAEGLRRLAAATGESQAELIRKGVRQLLRRGTRRKFHSMGAGKGDGSRPRWDPDGLHRKALGRD